MLRSWRAPGHRYQAADRAYSGILAGDRFGSSVANTGHLVDTNGDGLAVGAPGTSTGYVVLYKAGSTVPFHDFIDGATEGCGGQFGRYLANAGNVDVVNRVDLLVGAPKHSNGQSNEGKVCLFLSGASGTTPTQSTTWAYESNQAAAEAGVVAGLGDMTGDGIDDFAVGNPLEDNSPGSVPFAGRVRVWEGKSGGPALSHTISFSTTYDARCGSSIAQARVLNGALKGTDVNLDGIADLIEGEPTFSDSSGTPDEGRVRVFFGSAGALDATPDRTYESECSSCKLGTSVAGGDVNGDKQADAAIGLPGYSNGQTTEGRVFVFAGYW